MAVLIHVTIAFASIAWTSYLYFRPSKRRFMAAYGLVTATLASGTYLVVSTGSPLLSSCAAGLAYLGGVSAGLLAAHHNMTDEA